MKFHEVADFLENIRKEKGMTYKQIAQTFEYNDTTVSMILRGRYVAKFDVIEKIANALKIELYPIALEED